VNRLLRWLRQPVAPKSLDDGVDWDKFGRSFGRMIGGNLNTPPSDPESPVVRRWERGGKNRAAPEPTPRWSILLALTIVVLFGVFVFYLVLQVPLHPGH
jgi:hypothetical protein